MALLSCLLYLVRERFLFSRTLNFFFFRVGSMIKGVPRTRDPEIKSCLLYRLNQSGAPENIFYLKQNKQTKNNRKLRGKSVFPRHPLPSALFGGDAVDNVLSKSSPTCCDALRSARECRFPHPFLTQVEIPKWLLASGTAAPTRSVLGRCAPGAPPAGDPGTRLRRPLPAPAPRAARRARAGSRPVCGRGPRPATGSSSR